MSGVISRNEKYDVSISNRFPGVHKRGIRTHTRQTDRHTHDDDSNRRNAMRCISPKNEIYSNSQSYIWAFQSVRSFLDSPRTGRRYDRQIYRSAFVIGRNLQPCQTGPRYVRRLHCRHRRRPPFDHHGKGRQQASIKVHTSKSNHLTRGCARTNVTVNVGTNVGNIHACT